MFTGIIEEKGTISKIMKNASQAVLTIKAQKIMEDIHKGDSIAVNGICLTVTAFSKNEFQADVMHETLNRTALKNAKAGKQCKSGAGYGSRRQVWRSHGIRSH